MDVQSSVDGGGGSASGGDSADATNTLQQLLIGGGFPSLLLTCLIFFVGTCMAGFMPLYLVFSEAKVRLLAVAGAGMLLGAAMQIIVPEGFGAFQDLDGGDEGQAPPEWLAGMSLAAGFLTMVILDQAQQAHSHGHGGSCGSGGGGCSSLGGGLGGSGSPQPRGSGGFSVSVSVDGGGGSGGLFNGGPGAADPESALAASMGGSGSGSGSGGGVAELALAVGSGRSGRGRGGWAGGQAGSHQHGAPASSDGDDADGEAAPMLGAEGRRRGRHHQQQHLSPALNGGPLDGGSDGSGPPSNTIAALLVHAAADGLALGVAAAGSNASLQIVVAAAMVLHKAPVAIGLATFLMQARYPKARTKRALVAFAAATPLAALLTFVLLAALPISGSDVGVACCLLFSGGSVLYAAAVHILPQALPLGHGGAASAAPSGLARWAHIALLCAAALAPALLHALPEA